LIIYQSKLSESKSLVIQGLKDLTRASKWLEKVIIDGKIDTVPRNHCLYNLYMFLSQNKKDIKKINFVLVSLFNSNELEDREEFDRTKKDMINSKLNERINLDLRLEEYNFERILPKKIKKYSIKEVKDMIISLRKHAYLNLTYIPLYDLVLLYRQRGDVLFDKNIRLAITKNKEVKERVVHPMENTFNMICSGKISPNIFPFYHGGITMAANSEERGDEEKLFEAPSIINGCQTISIADNYLRKLEKENNPEQIDKFKQIHVIAKIVIGTTDNELREITNSNNRQSPTENWQLFSNDPIHFEIESTLKELGIFYERQKGKFDTVMKNTQEARHYINTNKFYISIPYLGQIICLSRQNLQWAAKPSEIFLNKKNHDLIFDDDISKYAKDMILISNSFKAIKRALQKYLELPAYSSDNTQKIFRKPLVKIYLYYLALLYFYQLESKKNLRNEYSKALNKIAPPALVSEFESFYKKIIFKTKEWYLKQSNDFKNEVSNKKLNEFLKKTCIELGIDLEDGNIPFTKTTIDWSEYS
jgi:hypothetical protein